MNARGYSIWMATRQEWDAWAVTVEDNRQVRPATSQELLNRSVAVLDAGEDAVVFSVGNAEWNFGDYPGGPVSAGAERHRDLPPRLARRVLHERVGRAGDGGAMRTLEVRAEDVRQDDITEGPPFAPVLWAGER